MKRLPRFFLLSIVLLFLGASFYIYFTPVNSFIYLNGWLTANGIPIQVPLPFENSWAFIYAAIPAGFSFYVQYNIAHGVKKGEG